MATITRILSDGDIIRHRKSWRSLLMKNGGRKLRFIVVHFVLLLVAAIIPNNVDEVSINRRLRSLLIPDFCAKIARAYDERADERCKWRFECGSNGPPATRPFYYLSNVTATLR